MTIHSASLSLAEENYYRRTKGEGPEIWGGVVCMAFHVRGPLDVPAFERAFAKVIARHESLRSTIVEADGQVRKLTDDALTIPIAIRDVLNASEEDLENIVGELSFTTFDLAKGPLVRAYLLRAHPEYSAFAVIAHHLVLDRSSMDTVCRDLSAFYAADKFATPLDGELPPPVAGAEFARWQRAFLAEHHDELRAFWKPYFARCNPIDESVLSFPDRDPSGERGVITFPIPEAAVKAGRAMASRAKAPLVAFAHAVLVVLLHRRTRRNGISVGYLLDLRSRYKLHNRENLDADIRDSVGCLFLGVPVHVDLDPAGPFEAVVRACQAEMLGVSSHCEAPPVMLFGGPAIAKTFNVLLNYQRVRAHFTLAGTTVEEFRAAPAIESRGRKAQVAIQFRLFEDLPQLSGLLAYDGSRMGRASARAFVDEYIELFERLALSPAEPLSSI